MQSSVEGSIDLYTGSSILRMERAVYLIILFSLESDDFPFAVHYESERDTLYTSCRELRLNLSPEHRGKFESYKSVQNTTCLLGIHEIHVDASWIFYGTQNRIFRDFMEDDSLGVFFL